VSSMIDIDPESLTNQERYKLLIGSILPRPIAFVSTLSPEGIPNLAPFSFFTGVCSSPLIVCFAPMIRGSDGQKKDTLRNIEQTQEFVLHVVTEDIVQQMNQTAAEYPADVSEFDASGLTPIPSEKVKPFRVKESPIQMECILHQIVSLGETVGSGSLVLGRVVQLHFSEDVYQDGKILTQKLKPVARLAGSSYAKVTDTFDLERPIVQSSASTGVAGK
jgi:flavin reductase (DIM6/NTAB) family NADH-FMN oxidoreductase RutF